MSKIFKSLDDIQPVKNNGTDKLGTGSFSKVNLVCHKQNPSKWYAMKEVALKNDKDKKLVFQEINLHMSLKHDNVIRFEDCIETPDKVYIFLEYAKNGDLFGFINKNKPNEQTMLKLFYQTCLAIQYIHSKNIMHRDLKPENILLDADLNVKLCDFGWSAEYFENVNRETLCGTYEYMAPEVFFRNKQTKKTDIWALGVLLYELFHGYAPFRGLRMDTVMHAIMRNVIAFKKNLSADIKDLIVKILIFDPKKRPAIQDILDHPLMSAFARSSVGSGSEKENLDKSSKSTNSDQKNFKKKVDLASNQFYNTISTSSDHKAQPRTFIKQSTLQNTPVHSVSNSANKHGDFSSHFKKKARTEDFNTAKLYSSVDKMASGHDSIVKRYNTSQFNNPASASIQNIYNAKPSNHNQSFQSSSSGIKIVAKRTIGNTVDLYGTNSNFGKYTRPESSGSHFRSIYNTSTTGVRYNFVKQRTMPESDKSFANYLSAYAK